jgi:hypothetical protein
MSQGTTGVSPNQQHSALPFRAIVVLSRWQGCRVVPKRTRRSCKTRIMEKYHHTDAIAFEQYPHQTTSGRRELAASQDYNNSTCSRPASRLQEPRSPERADIAHSSPESTPHKLTSHAPYGPAVQDFQFQHRRHPSSTSSHPSSLKNASTLPYHASSSPPREPTFAVDFDAGKAPKTLTRNKIQIPPRTRYAAPITSMSIAMSPVSNTFQQLITQQQRQQYCQQHRRHPPAHALYWQTSYYFKRLVLRTYHTRHNERY